MQKRTGPARSKTRAGKNWGQEEGTPAPLGATWVDKEQAYNFAVYSEHAETVTLLLFAPADLTKPCFTFHFDSLRNKSGPIWHCRVPSSVIGRARYYAYSVSGLSPEHWRSFNPEKILLDPYAKCIFFPPSFDRDLAIQEGSNAGKAALGLIAAQWPASGRAIRQIRHHEADAIIYELHVREFTKNPNSGINPARAGTYAGLEEKIPYLRELGVTIVELMPMFQRDPQEGDYWGYMPLNFFSPHSGYASRRDLSEQHLEFRKMVDAFHRANIEVVLDVVYNHTCEGNQKGPIYSYKGFGSGEYYMMTEDPENPYANYSGSGNTLNFTRPQVRQMVIDSLRYWRDEMGVDGFRFDLASVFSRNPDGSLDSEPPIFSEIASHPDLYNLRLIAEPWDAAGAYQIGRSFPGITWLQWNGRFRDDVRRFVKGEPGTVPSLVRRLYGSDDLFPDDRASAYHAYQSVNFIACHDGFTLYDLVSYNEKRNLANGHDNRDGTDENYSWNCGYEDDQDVPPEVMALRRRQVKNFCCLLMISNGTPMFRAGDEFLRTQGGNNNPYNQDNEIGWLNWDNCQANQDIFRFFQRMIAFRKAHPSLSRSRFWRADVSWYGASGEIDLSDDSHSLAFYLDGGSQADDDLYVMINAYWEDVAFTIQEGTADQWKRVVDTNLASPGDFSEAGAPLHSTNYMVGARSVVVLIRSARD